MWLSGIRIIDFTNLLPGPYATMRLADLGCEVIKVEGPNGGDPARYAGPKVAGMGVMFMANNRNKQSIVIDLKSEIGRAKALALIQGADVVIEGFRPGVMQKLGLGYPTLRTNHPSIIYCSLTGYGQTGPFANLAGHDLNYMAVSGMLAQLHDDTGKLITPNVQFADLIGGIVASEAILAALVKRERTGEGSYIDVSMVDALTGMLHGHALLQNTLGEGHGISELNGTQICYHLYQTKDERTVSLAALEPKFWHAFCTCVGKPEWLEFGSRKAVDGDPIYEAVKTLFFSRTLLEWTSFAKSTDCCIQPVFNMSEVLDGEQVKTRNMIYDIPLEECNFSEAKSSESNSNTSLPFLLQVDTHAGGNRVNRPTPNMLQAFQAKN